MGTPSPIPPPTPGPIAPPPAGVNFPPPDLSVGGVVGRAFEVYRRALVPIGALSAASSLIVGIPAIFISTTQLGAQTTPGQALATALMGFSFGLVALVLAIILYPLIVPATSRMAAVVLRDPQASPPAPMQALRDAGPGWPGAFVALALLLLGAVAGLILLIVPGVIWLLMWSLVGPILALEGVHGKAALRRSASLTKGHKGAIFWIFLVLILPFLVVGAVASGIETVAGSASWGSSIATWILNAIMAFVWDPILTLATVEIYFRIVASKEGAPAMPAGTTPPAPSGTFA
ncbi:MAG: hypothetical protein ACYDDF_00200 [Thermoplasmatota archaeon]